jgi:hypothetical protein
MASNPKNVTIYGRLSFPVFTAKEAYDKSQGSQYPAKEISEAKPNFMLLVEQPQLDKLQAHILNEFFPYCLQQSKDGEKSDVLSATEIKDLTKQVKGPDYDGVYNTRLKTGRGKSAALAPECVAAVKVLGTAGTDIELKAIVNGEDELVVPDPDLLSWPVIKPISATVHSMYPGALVAVTLNLYAYHNGKLPGFSAGANVAVFKANADRFGGGVAIDESEIFLD